MQRPKNLKVGDKFRVIEKSTRFDVGDIITLKWDDGTYCPHFWNGDRSDYWSINFSNLEPYTKTARDAQVGDIVVDSDGDKQIVLERWQNSVLLSYISGFEGESSTIYTFNELDGYFTLKAEPVVDDKTAEAIKLLKEEGYKISK